MPRPRLCSVQLETREDRVVARVRDVDARFIELEVRRARRQGDPRARVERFLSELALTLP
ncbi:MAG: hypothetical protein H6719_37060 [Sandaracinaceae bacterium]|nr:hypothetical protein [Sandaracinaceae bacterium]